MIGHVERAWSFSFRWPNAGRQTDVFQSCLEALLAGKPVGLAMEHFNDRYSSLGTDLLEVQRNDEDRWSIPG